MARVVFIAATNAVLFAGALLFFAGVAFSSAASQHPLGVPVSFVVGVPALAMAVLEYFATFQASRLAERLASVGLVLGGSGLFLVAGAMIAQPMIAGQLPPSDYLIQLVGPTVLVASWFICTHFLNQLWLTQARHNSSPIPHSDESTPGDMSRLQNPRARFSLRECLLLMSALCIVFTGVAFGIADIRSHERSDIAPADLIALPPAAHDLSIMRAYNGTAVCNFAIDEAGFWKWLHSFGGMDKTDAKQVDGVYMVVTCTRDQPPQQVMHTVRRGWYIEWSDGSTGEYAYDTDLGRAYYQGPTH